ncbi:myosin heavy chain [Sticta canariensis]|nr:myosin heavy chain [Sticta canariensis]
MAYLTMLFESFLFVFSNILEIIEDVYPFAESYFDGQRDFEKVDAFIHLAVVFSFKLLCSALFIAFLMLWTWYNLLLKRSFRQDLEAERDDALNTIQQLVVQISELEAMSEKTLVDRNTTLHDYSLLATEKTVLENKLARLQSQPDLQAICWNLKSSLERSQAQCLDLELSLEPSKRLRRDEDSERNELSKQAKRARSELIEVKTSLRLKLECLKADHNENLIVMKKQLDQAKAALPAKLVQLQKENKLGNDEVTLLREILKAQKIKFEAQIDKQSLQIKKLERDLISKQRKHEELEKIYKDLADSEQQEEAHDAEPKMVMDGELQNEIRELKISLNSKTEAISSYQLQIAELEEEIKAEKAEKAKEFFQDNGSTSLQNTKPERLLEAEDTGHDDLESRELEKLPAQRHQLCEIITSLEEMTGNRDQHRAATETYRMQHVEAQKEVKASEGGEQNKLVKAIGELDGKTAGTVEEKGRRTELGIHWRFHFSIFPFSISYGCIDFCDILEF